MQDRNPVTTSQLSDAVRPPCTNPRNYNGFNACTSPAR